MADCLSVIFDVSCMCEHDGVVESGEMVQAMRESSLSSDKKST